MDIEKFWLNHRKDLKNIEDVAARNDFRDAEDSDSVERTDDCALSRLSDAAEYAYWRRRDEDLMRHRPPLSDCLYVIGSNGNNGSGEISKIGITYNIYRRFAHIQAHSPLMCSLTLCVRVGVTHARALEMNLHKDLRRLRSHGEWFAIAPDDAARRVVATCIDRGIEYEAVEFSEDDRLRYRSARRAIEHERARKAEEDRVIAARWMKGWSSRG